MGALWGGLAMGLWKFATLPRGPVLGGYSSWKLAAPLGVAIVASYLLIVFSEHSLRMKAMFSLLAIVQLVLVFSTLYFYAGVNVSEAFYAEKKAHAPLSKLYPGFGEPLSRSGAVYFTVGTLTTAGTGSLSARSTEARGIAIVQMVLDLALVGFGIAGLARPARQQMRFVRSNPRNDTSSL